jgi:hypothetical protein
MSFECSYGISPRESKAAASLISRLIRPRFFIANATSARPGRGRVFFYAFPYFCSRASAQKSCRVVIASNHATSSQTRPSIVAFLIASSAPRSRSFSASSRIMYLSAAAKSFKVGICHPSVLIRAALLAASGNHFRYWPIAKRIATFAFRTMRVRGIAFEFVLAFCAKPMSRGIGRVSRLVVEYHPFLAFGVGNSCLGVSSISFRASQT